MASSSSRQTTRLRPAPRASRAAARAVPHRRRAAGRLAAAVVLPGFLGACAAGADGGAEVTARSFVAERYLGIETIPLDDDLVNFHLALEGAMDGPRAVTAYAECAAAGYALARGDGFARHVRTNLAEEAGIWRGDAVYTISPALPRGLMTIDVEVAAADCEDRGIPTV